MLLDMPAPPSSAPSSSATSAASGGVPKTLTAAGKAGKAGGAEAAGAADAAGKVGKAGAVGVAGAAGKACGAGTVKAAEAARVPVKQGEHYQQAQVALVDACAHEDGHVETARILLDYIRLAEVR